MDFGQMFTKCISCTCLRLNGCASCFRCKHGTHATNTAFQCILSRQAPVVDSEQELVRKISRSCLCMKENWFFPYKFDSVVLSDTLFELTNKISDQNWKKNLERPEAVLFEVASSLSHFANPQLGWVTLKRDSCDRSHNINRPFHSALAAYFSPIIPAHWSPSLRVMWRTP